ncbi:MAG: Holliday junction resolvase RecU [Eubacteriaceae bacterium]|nr:Holliday junction resolvase RecU [Eubacteriaceae bacterium]
MDDDLAVVQKLPTSIKPVKLGKEKGVITLAYFDAKSTVDYMGNVQGIPICFDAKETSKPYLPISNIKAHQIEFMGKFSQQGGLSFLIVSFTLYDKIMLLGYSELKKHWQGAQSGLRKSIPFTSFDTNLAVPSQSRYPVHYLHSLNIYLSILDEEKESLNGQGA